MLTEQNLAEDPETQLTDQNHIGGAPFVEQLGEYAEISAASQVLDLGAGLGGPARLLAWRYGCKVFGIDLSKDRCRDARRLTNCVGLQEQVKFKCGNFLTVPVPSQKFDVLWGQGAWAHVKHKPQFIQRWVAALRPGGRIAFEESVVCHAPSNKREAHLLRRLARIWKAYLVSPKDWISIVERSGCSIHLCQDLSRPMSQYCQRMLGAVHRLKEYPRSERDAFEFAIELAKKDVLGYMRMVAVNSRH